MTPRHGGRPTPAGTTALAQLAALAAAAVLLVWASGIVSAVVIHHQLPSSGLAEVGAVTVRLLQNPATRQPHGRRRTAPGSLARPPSTPSSHCWQSVRPR